MNKFLIFKNIIHCENIASTNDYAKKLIKDNVIQENSIVFAENQIQGKGRYGNRWYSEKDKSLTFSFVLFMNFNFNKIKYLEKMVLKNIKIVLEHNGVNSRIKLPNDIYYDNKKIGGILFENKLSKYTIIGVGLNINNTKYPYWVPNPVSLKQIIGKNISIEKIFNEVCVAFEKDYLLMQ